MCLVRVCRRWLLFWGRRVYLFLELVLTGRLLTLNVRIIGPLPVRLCELTVVTLVATLDNCPDNDVRLCVGIFLLNVVVTPPCNVISSSCSLPEWVVPQMAEASCLVGPATGYVLPFTRKNNCAKKGFVFEEVAVGGG